MVLPPAKPSGAAVAVDQAGAAYLAGNTDITNLPTTSGALLSKGVGAFVAKVKSDGSGLSYLTYLGASANSSLAAAANTAAAIACDSKGSAYLIGSTSDPNFPVTPGAWQTAFRGKGSSSIAPLTDAFAVKLKPDGGGLVWATYLGGNAADTASSLAIDTSDQVWLVGTTASPDFPNAQGWSQGSDFIAGLNSSGSSLLYSARYPADGVSNSIAVDANGLLHVSGPAGVVSTIAPFTSPLPRVFGVANAASDAIGGRIASGEVVSIYGPHIGPAIPITTVPDSSGNLPTTVNGYQVLLNPGAAPLPLLYVSDSQINAVIPFLSDKAARLLYVMSPSASTPAFPITVVSAVPEIFHNPDSSAVAVNQDGTLNTSDNPAPSGSYASIWVTGANLPYLTNSTGGEAKYGQIAMYTSDYLCCDVEIFHAKTSVSYAGTAPGAVFGISQVNFHLRGILLMGTYTIPIRAIASDGSVSAPVYLYVRSF